MTCCWLRRTVRLSVLVVTTSAVCAQTANQFQAHVVHANTRFSFKLFHQLVTWFSDKNILLAPTGLSLTFALLDNGADPETRKEIERTFEFAGLDLKEINEGFAALRQTLQLAQPKQWSTKPAWMTPQQWKTFRTAPPNGTLIADSIWLNRVAFTESFLSVNNQYYGADVKRLWAAPSPSAQISQWATKRTTRSVQINPGPLAKNDFLLVDVTHFRTFWTHDFLESATKPGPFTLLGGQKKQVPFMYQTAHFIYLQGPKFQAVLLPYSNNTHMCVVLPGEDSSLSELEQNLTAANWQDWQKLFEGRLGLVGLPRFQIETGFDVRSALAEIGLTRPFETYAAFSPIVPLDGAKLTAAIQKTNIKVDERGTEAISVGLMGGVAGGIAGGQIGLPPKPFEMIVNRPFFFAIADDLTGHLLFLGAVVDP
jgi:serine protease inhibitor